MPAALPTRKPSRKKTATTETQKLSPIVGPIAIVPIAAFATSGRVEVPATLPLPFGDKRLHNACIDVEGKGAKEAVSKNGNIAAWTLLPDGTYRMFFDMLPTAAYYSEALGRTVAETDDATIVRHDFQFPHLVKDHVRGERVAQMGELGVALGDATWKVEVESVNGKPKRVILTAV